ncbi:MAG: TetR/AcrR family transcriptional regulator [Mycetocola sp.]
MDRAQPQHDKENPISTESTPPRRMRADAVKNRARILEAARIEVELGGTECSLDNVARRAGVGPGTLYRHFPTREALVSELLLTWVVDVEADADGTAAVHWVEVLDWLVRLAGYAMTYHGLASTLAATEGDESSPLRTAHEVIINANKRVFDRAIRSGAVGAPVDSIEVSRLVTGVAMVAEVGHIVSDDVREMLAVVLNGLTHPQPAH